MDAKQLLMNQLNLVMKENRQALEDEVANSAEKFKMRVAAKIAKMTQQNAAYICRQWPYNPSSQAAAFEALINESVYYDHDA